MNFLQLIFTTVNKIDDYEVRLNQKNLEKVNFLAKGVIKIAFCLCSKIDVDAEVIVEFARIFGFEIDFQRDIRKNDEFQIFYERFEDDEGENFKNGNILFAYLKNSGREIKLYRYKDRKIILVILHLMEKVLKKL